MMRLKQDWLKRTSSTQKCRKMSQKVRFSSERKYDCARTSDAFAAALCDIYHITQLIHLRYCKFKTTTPFFIIISVKKKSLYNV